MTKAACNLIFRIAKVFLAWRTIKALRRNNDDKIKPKDPNGPNCHHVVKIDWEILQLWALYAFHSLYQYSGLEFFVAVFPFYYYFKMVLIIITFLIPRTKFASFWFDIVLLPMMHYTHELLNLDWKGFIQKEAILLPWQFLDLFLLPGLFTEEEEASFIFKLRDDQLKRSSQKYSNSEIDSCESNDKKIENEHGTQEISPRKQNKILETSSFTSPVARSRLAASSLHLRKFSQEHRFPTEETDFEETEKRRPPSPSNISVSSSPSRMTTPKAKNSEPESILNSSPRRKVKGGRPPSVAFKQTKSSLLSQTSKSPTKSKSKPFPESKYERDRRILHSVLDEDDDTISLSSRRSVSNSVRKFITGDDNIRIRDFLFDIELPAIPSQNRVGDGDDLTVRSSRSTRSARSTKSTLSTRSYMRSTALEEERRKSLEKWRRERDARNTKKDKVSSRSRSTRLKPDEEPNLSQRSTTTRPRLQPENMDGMRRRSARTSKE